MGRILKRRVLLTCTALAVAGSAGTAEAQRSFEGCAQGSSSSFAVCASADTWYNAASGTLFFNVINLNASSASSPSFSDYSSATGGWHTIAAVGLENMVLGTHYTIGSAGLSLALNYWNGSTFRAITPTKWKVGANSLQIANTGTSTDGHKQGLVGGYDPGQPQHEHLQTTNGRYAQFAIRGFTDFRYSDDVRFEWHSKQVATESCTSSTGGCATANSLKGSIPPTNVVPEPISMVLLGSGLAGVGALRARSRRKDAVGGVS